MHNDSGSHYALEYFLNRQMESIPDVLSKQLNIYQDKLEHDAAHLNMPGGVDVNNHEDIFRALMEKVPLVVTFYYKCNVGIPHIGVLMDH